MINKILGLYEKNLFLLLLILFVNNLYSSKINNWLLIYGDVMQIALPVFSFSYTIYNRDYKGSIKFAEAFSISQLFVYLLKQTNEERPNEKEHGKSFPSGHTESAFFASAFLDYRYNIRSKYWFYSLAGIVGISRVVNKKHWIHDVIAGAFIGIYTNKIFIKPFNDSQALLIPQLYKENLYLTINRKF